MKLGIITKWWRNNFRQNYKPINYIFKIKLRFTSIAWRGQTYKIYLRSNKYKFYKLFIWISHLNCSYQRLFPIENWKYIFFISDIRNIEHFEDKRMIIFRIIHPKFFVILWGCERINRQKGCQFSIENSRSNFPQRGSKLRWFFLQKPIGIRVRITKKKEAEGRTIQTVPIEKHGCSVSARGTTAQGGEFNRIGVIKSHFYTIFPRWGRGK